MAFVLTDPQPTPGGWFRLRIEYLADLRVDVKVSPPKADDPSRPGYHVSGLWQSAPRLSSRWR